MGTGEFIALVSTDALTASACGSEAFGRITGCEGLVAVVSPEAPSALGRALNNIPNSQDMALRYTLEGLSNSLCNAMMENMTFDTKMLVDMSFELYERVGLCTYTKGKTL